VLPQLALAEALVLAVVLAATDAALGQAVVSDERLPASIRQGLNLRSPTCCASRGDVTTCVLCES
jgi:sodium/hydrogen antiporter